MTLYMLWDITNPGVAMLRSRGDIVRSGIMCTGLVWLYVCMVWFGAYRFGVCGSLLLDDPWVEGLLYSFSYWTTPLGDSVVPTWFSLSLVCISHVLRHVTSMIDVIIS